MSAGIVLLVLGLADDHELGVVALGAHLGQRLEQRREALHRHVGAGGGHQPAGDARDRRAAAGRSRGRRRPGTMCSRSAGTPIWATMSRLLDSDTVTSRGICARDASSASRGTRTSGAARSAGTRSVACARSRSRSTVMGWCSVHEHRPAVVVHHREQPGAEALVVVDEVEVGAPVLQEPAGRAG